MLQKANVVGTPGSGFGASGEGYFRLSAFNSRENVEEHCFKDNGSECLLYPYLYCETKIKSPINNVGIIDPEGILKGWKKTVLIIIAIKPAEKIIFKASHLLSLVKTIYRTKSNSKIIDNCINYYFFKKLIITLETT